MAVDDPGFPDTAIMFLLIRMIWNAVAGIIFTLFTRKGTGMQQDY